MKYYLIAGEASGDLHGSNLMRGLKNSDPTAQFRFWGGELMADVGGEMVKHYKEGAIMGVVEVIKSLDKISANLKLCKKDLLEYNPDVVILIDYPGFNFRIAKFAKEHSIKVFYYIAPKVWAWKESRVKRIKKYVDNLFIIFPFEVEYFQKWNIDAIYCGNPLIDKIEESIAVKETRAEFLKRHSLEDKPSIALLAGSRRMEINFLLPRLVKVAESYGGDYHFLLAAAPSTERSFYEKYIPTGSQIQIIENDTYGAIRHSDAAIISSGTASLETALIGTPQVVCYGVNPISYWIGRRLLKVKYVSLGNLIINRLAFKELLQNECTPESITSELSNLLEDQAYRKEMKSSYLEIRNALGEKGASERVAEAMMQKLLL